MEFWNWVDGVIKLVPVINYKLASLLKPLICRHQGRVKFPTSILSTDSEFQLALKDLCNLQIVLKCSLKYDWQYTNGSSPYWNTWFVLQDSIFISYCNINVVGHSPAVGVAIGPQSLNEIQSWPSERAELNKCCLLLPILGTEKWCTYHVLKTKKISVGFVGRFGMYLKGISSVFKTCFWTTNGSILTERTGKSLMARFPDGSQ